MNIFYKQIMIYVYIYLHIFYMKNFLPSFIKKYFHFNLFCIFVYFLTSDIAI